MKYLRLPLLAVVLAVATLAGGLALVAVASFPTESVLLKHRDFP